MLVNCITTFVTFTSWAKLQLLKGWALDVFLMMCQRWEINGNSKHSGNTNNELQRLFYQLPTIITWFEEIWAFSMALKTKVGCSMD